MGEPKKIPVKRGDELLEGWIAFECTGSTGSWEGSVRIEKDHIHRLKGGVLVHVSPATVEAAATEALQVEVDALDFDKLKQDRG